MYFCSFVSIQYVICECGDTFPTEEALKQHLEKDHVQETETHVEYKCDKCDKVFPTQTGYYRHQRVHRRVSDKPREHKGQTKVKGYYIAKNIVCEVCGKRYASKAALGYHQRTHTGERPYQCSQCPKAFTMPLFLKIHERTHTGERPYQCSLCSKAFSNRAALLRHDRVHTGHKPYVCPICSKAFTQSNSMKLHVNTVHLKMPAPYKRKHPRNKPLGLQYKVEIERDDLSQEDETQVKTEVKSEFTGDYQESVVSVYEENGRLYSQDGEVYEEVYEQDAYNEEIVENSVEPLFHTDNGEVLYEEVYEDV